MNAVVGETDITGDVITTLGLSNRDEDGLLEHSTKDDQMAVAGQDKLSPGILFTLPAETQLETAVIWNYNKPAYTDQGIAKMDVSVWTEQDGWKTILKDAELNEAEGTDDYDEPTVLVFEPVQAQKIRFDNLTAFDSKAPQIGLSAVRFHEPLGPAACNPSPSNESTASYAEPAVLSWVPGRGAVVHDVYVGQTPESLEFLGRIKGQPLVKVSGLAANNTYHWRIDEVNVDGEVETGPIWSFTTSGALIGHWSLDETQEDAVGTRRGTLGGQPTFQDGKEGKTLAFDGRSDYVQIPALNTDSDTLTLCGWVQADAQVDDIPGLIFCRTGNTVAGIHMFGDSLRYHWNDREETYNWDSGIRIPLDGSSWVFVALTVQPDKAVLYACKDGQWESSANTILHTPEEFDGPLYLARDPQEQRFFKGMIDEVRVFSFALNADQIKQVYETQSLDVSSPQTIQLVDADIVEQDASLKKVAAEQASQTETPEKKTNVLPVVIIIGVILVVVIVSTLKKKK